MEIVIEWRFLRSDPHKHKNEQFHNVQYFVIRQKSKTRSLIGSDMKKNSGSDKACLDKEVKLYNYKTLGIGSDNNVIRIRTWKWNLVDNM